MLGLADAGGAPVHTIPAALRAAAERFGDRPAYVDGTGTTSFAALAERVRRVAAAYAAAGLEPGQRAGLWAPNGVDWAVAALAVSWAGGILVPLNSRYTAHEVADVLDRTGAVLVVVADGFLGRTQIADLTRVGTAAAILDLAGLADSQPSPAELAAVDHRAAAVRPDDVADILFTSGTTGHSKGVLSAHRQSLGVARVWAGLGGVRDTDRYLAVNPFFHSFGYKAGILVGLVSGAALYPMATFDATAALELVDRARITVLPAAPAVFGSLLAAPDRASYDLSSLRLAVTGAATIPVTLIERLRTELGIAQVVTAFGMTEAVVVTMCRGDETATTVATTNGRAVDGMEVRILDPDPQGAGELLVRGAYVMLGYLDDPEATAQAIDADGWLHTGDVGVLDGDGNLRITDRIKDLYISGGFNVSPAEVEQVIARVPGVAEAAVVGVPDERLGEVGRAYVVLAEGAALTEEQLLAACRERLANFKLPCQVEFRPALPRNLSGKVLKAELRDERNPADA